MLWTDKVRLWFILSARLFRTPACAKSFSMRYFSILLFWADSSMCRRWWYSKCVLFRLTDATTALEAMLVTNRLTRQWARYSQVANYAQVDDVLMRTQLLMDSWLMQLPTKRWRHILINSVQVTLINYTYRKTLVTSEKKFCLVEYCQYGTHSQLTQIFHRWRLLDEQYIQLISRSFYSVVMIELSN